MDSSIAVPIVRYGVENKKIPGDPTGWKMKDCGNICHWTGRDRYRSYPRFSAADFQQREDDRIKAVETFLAYIAQVAGVEAVRQHGTVVRDTLEELVIDHHFRGFDVRVIRLRDVSYTDKGSYTKAERAQELEKRSEEKMTAAEPVMGRGVENLLMAQRMHRGEAPPIPMHRAAKDNPEENENRGKWYKTMRVEACRRFWVGTTRKERDKIRDAAAAQPSDELAPIIEQIEREDNSHTKDYFWEHQRDQAAAADEEIYERVSKDIVLILDKDSNVLLCSFKRLFQFLFGEKGKDKVEDAIRKWSSLPPLPVPETARHMVDDLIRQQHPELDLEKAQSLEELEQRYQCVVHYGTWAMQGRTNPDLVFRTAVAPAEHRECCDVFQALPKTDRVGLSKPTFATLFALGINSFTGRHADKTDVRHGFAGLVALGDYVGGNICFPPLAMALDYQPGDCVIFRGAEMEHFVADWTGYRIFLLYTTHQPVRNYAHRIMGKLPPKPNDLWHPDRVREREEAGEVTLAPESEPDIDSYDPCYTEPLSPEPETLYEADIQGPAYIPSDLLYADSTTGSSDKSSVSSYLDHGRIMVEGPEFKKRKTEN
ncbi:hypothetical protein DL769_005942 [Monosporascus sp. CRB-8-3]|nr:hypothetical protein DL769_005942 [Monosporascus sp. CRB-8-3]